MTSPIAAVRSLPRFAYLSPAEAREVVLAVLGAVRELPDHFFEDGGAIDPDVIGYDLGAETHWGIILDALVAEVQEEGRPLPPASDSVDS